MSRTFSTRWNSVRSLRPTSSTATRTLPRLTRPEADTLATYEVLKAQLDRYPTLENDVNALAEFSARGETVDYAGRIVYDSKGNEVFGFGKYKGRARKRGFRNRSELLYVDDERGFSAVYQEGHYGDTIQGEKR